MIKIYTIENCPYCAELKEKLDGHNIKYQECDINNNTKYSKEFEVLSEIADTDLVPIMLIDKQVFAPEKSFSSIDEAVDLAIKFTR